MAARAEFADQTGLCFWMKALIVFIISVRAASFVSQ
jgi:hypothetical protein